MTIRRLLIGFAAAVAFAVAAHGVYWWIAVDRLERGFAAWVEERRADGWTVTHGAPGFGGYPLRVRTSIADPDLAGPGDPPRWRWRGAGLVLGVALWRPREIRFSSPGRHRLAIGHDGRTETVDAVAASVVGRARTGADGRLESLVLEAASVDAVGSRMVGRLHIGRLDAALFVPGSPGGEAARADGTEPPGPFLSLETRDVVLPEGRRYPLGRAVPAFALEAKLLGEVAIEPTLSASLAAWRDSGGTVEVVRLDTIWGKFDLSADGTLALDKVLQPVIAMTARVRGYRETVDALVAAGYVRDRDAMAAKLVLNVIARATPGGAARLTVPVTVQDGVLSAGPVRLLRVPPIDWRKGAFSGG